MRQALWIPVFLCGTLVFGAEPVLVGHWKLDEKEGNVATDSSPSKNNGKLSGNIGRTTGKFGGAMEFDGKSWIEIPNSKELEDVQEGSFTLAAWVKAADVPPGKEEENTAQYMIIAKTGWHLGISYTNEKKFVFSYWLKGTQDPVWTGTGAWDQDYEPAEWHHVVAVVDRDARTASFYLDGEHKAATEQWDTGAAPRDYEQVTWKIGAANPGSDKWAWYAKSAIGDVRIYSGALNAEKIKALYDGK